jgi:phospholipid/cholesterol/gamma-HCH transport system permease protein
VGDIPQGRGKELRQAGNPTQRVGQFDRAQDGFGHRLGRGHAQGIDIGVTVAQGEGEDRISIEHGIHRIDGASHAQRAELRQFVGFHLIEHGVGGDRGKSRVPAGKTPRGLLLQAGRSVEKLTTAGIFTGARDHFAGGRIAHVAERIDGNQGGHHHAFGESHGERTDAGLHGAGHAEDFADGGAGARAHAPFLHRFGGSSGRRRFAHRQVGANPCLADRQIEQDGRGNDGHFGHAGIETHAAMLQVTPHATGGFQAESAAAGQQNAMNPAGHVTRVERGSLLGAAGGTADVHPGHGSLFTKDYSASGESVEIRYMTDAQPRDVSKSFHVGGFMVASEFGVPPNLLDLLKEPVQAVQDFLMLTGRALKNMFRSPHYTDDIFLQMDGIGVGSLQIVALTGTFSGAVMALQMARALASYGQVGKTGTLVSLTLVRELGPVLTALMVAGRNASGIASELGSMKVTEQIDAMRALGTDPVQKLVTPRVIATAVMLPLLVIIADFVGLAGGWLIADFFLSIPSKQYWNSAWRALDWSDVAQGLLKPLVFALVISLIGCYYGLRTTGGTQGVGRSTTQAVVMATVLIFIFDLMITKIWVS